MKIKNTKIVSICTLLFGVLLMIAGFCVPPKGVIDGSVLTGLGELFTFASAIDGLDYLRGKYKIKNEEDENRDSQ
ncbi:MAG: hypothetical protein MJ197_08780 [Bacteroidales bacterium]|nr:hypothetical protein [Bacteroidales bacterium]